MFVITKVILLTVIGVVTSQKLKSGDSLWCVKEIPNNANGTLEELVELKNSNRSAIYFLETTCKSWVNKKVTLNPRQICAAESAAKLNPDADIYILLPVITKLEPDEHLKTLLEYSNIYFRYINIQNLVKGTPMADGIMLNLFHSKWAVWHLSDILRFLVLYKFGGTYLDFDIVVMKSLKELGTNYAGRDAEPYLDVGVLSFDKDGFGHDVIGLVLAMQKEFYNPNAYGENGSAWVTAALEEKCGVKGIDKLMSDCKKFKVHPSKVFYPLDWNVWRHYFEEDKFETAINQTKNAFTLHLWNSDSHKFQLNKNAKTAYNYWANKQCPKLFGSLKDQF